MALLGLPKQTALIYACTHSSEGVDISNNVKAALSVLEDKNKNSIKFIRPETPGITLNAFHMNWETMGAMPTRQKWLGINTGRVCYQFDGIHGAEIKNPTPEELSAIMGGFKEYTLVRVGLPMTLPRVINEMAGASAFIGINSGMTQVAICVGVPVILFVPERAKNFAGKDFEKFKNVMLCRTTEELITKTKTYLRVRAPI